MTKLNFYRLEASAMFAAKCDPRFHYCTYMPKSYDPEGDRSYPLLVLIHPSLRNASGLRDEFIDFAEATQCALLAPLFPCGIEGTDDFNNYKHMRYGGVAYDDVLLGMVEEVSGIFRLESSRFMMHGFSGGGQFALRFYLRHPERLQAISIGAPGTVTLPGDPRSWWVGTGDMEQALGAPLRLETMREVPVQLVIGSEDISPRGTMVAPGSSFWREDANDAGENRMQRIEAFERALVALGINAEKAIVPGVAHARAGIQPPVKEFFARVLGYELLN
ncbi:alpha/beta hydrolase [Roseibium algae]|uniref:Alpha/beta hydrolase n=1 Tax=Roseibium algae TaxID=3123038 RepID=A0ABU8THX9_9HYPH